MSIAHWLCVTCLAASAPHDGLASAPWTSVRVRALPQYARIPGLPAAFAEQVEHGAALFAMRPNGALNKLLSIVPAKEITVEDGRPVAGARLFFLRLNVPLALANGARLRPGAYVVRAKRSPKSALAFMPSAQDDGKVAVDVELLDRDGIARQPVEFSIEAPPTEGGIHPLVARLHDEVLELQISLVERVGAVIRCRALP